MIGSIGKIQHTDSTNSFRGLSTSVWFNGCSFKCPGCHNASLWANKNDIDLKEFIETKYDTNLALLGGEPLDYENLRSTKYLIEAHKLAYPDKDILLWTGFSVEEASRRLGDTFNHLTFLKSGVFNINLKIKGRFYGSSNQDAYLLHNSEITHIWSECEKQWRVLNEHHETRSVNQ